MGIYPPPKLGHLRRCDVPQGDVVSIPAEGLLRGGEFVISDLNDKGNAGGEVTLRLKRLRLPKLVGGTLVLGAPTFGRPRLLLAVDSSARLDLDNRLWRRRKAPSR